MHVRNRYPDVMPSKHRRLIAQCASNNGYSVLEQFRRLRSLHALTENFGQIIPAAKRCMRATQ